MQSHTSKTGCRGCHCDPEQHMSCLNYVFVYGFRQVLIGSTRRFYFVGELLFCDKLQTHLGALLLGRVLLIGTLRYIFLALTHWYWHFEKHHGYGLTQIDEINSGTTIHVSCSAQPIPCLLMLCRLKEPVHQEAWYWPPQLQYSISSIRRVNYTIHCNR